MTTCNDATASSSCGNCAAGSKVSILTTFSCGGAWDLELDEASVLEAVPRLEEGVVVGG